MYKNKYLKYKSKYINLKDKIGGGKFKSAVNSFIIKSKKKCLTHDDPILNDNLKMKEFITRFQNDLKYYCPKKSTMISGDIIDIRPVSHTINPEMLNVVSEHYFNQSTEFYSLGVETGSYLLEEIFTKEDDYALTDISAIYYTSTEYFGVYDIGLFEKGTSIRNQNPPDPTRTQPYELELYIIKNGLLVKEGTIPLNNERQCLHFTAYNHAMLFVRDTDGEIYFFDPNTSPDNNPYYQTILKEKVKILSCFKGVDTTKNINILFPPIKLVFANELNDEWVNQNYDNIYISPNSYGVCLAICRWFKLLLLINPNKTLKEIQIYFISKIVYYVLKCIDRLNEFNNIYNQIKSQINTGSNYLTLILEDKLNPKINKDVTIGRDNFIANTCNKCNEFNVKIENYFNEIKRKINESNYFEQAVIGYYLFLYEFNMVVITKIIDTFYHNGIFKYPNFLTKLESNEILPRYEGWNTYIKHWDECFKSKDSKECKDAIYNPNNRHNKNFWCVPWVKKHPLTILIYNIFSTFYTNNNCEWVGINTESRSKALKICKETLSETYNKFVGLYDPNDTRSIGVDGFRYRFNDVIFFIVYGADLITPFYYDLNLNKVRTLLEYGANVDDQHTSGETTLILESSKGHEDIVKILLEHGADINHKDNRGNTALIIAIEKGHENIVKILLENGANKSIEI